MHQRIKPPLKEVGFPKIQHSDPLSFILNRLRVTHMQFCLFFFERVGGWGGGGGGSNGSFNNLPTFCMLPSSDSLILSMVSVFITLVPVTINIDAMSRMIYNLEFKIEIM